MSLQEPLQHFAWVQPRLSLEIVKRLLCHLQAVLQVQQWLHQMVALDMCNWVQRQQVRCCRLPRLRLALSALQIDPQAADDGAGDMSGDKLWHQQQLASGAEHVPLGAAAEGGASDAAVKVGV